MSLNSSSPTDGSSSLWEAELRKLFDEERAEELVAMQEYAYKQATGLVQDYQRIFSLDNGDFIRDEGLLPAPKDKIKRAYTLYFSQLPESKHFQTFKEIVHLGFFGQKMEACNIDLTYLVDERQTLSGNSEADTKVYERFWENEILKAHYDKFAEELNFEAKANQWRKALIDEFTRLGSSPYKVVDYLEEFSDGKWSSQLFADYRSLMQNLSKTSNQSTGCLSLLMMAALPVATYELARLFT